MEHGNVFLHEQSPVDPCYLLYIGDYTSQSSRGCNKLLKGSCKDPYEPISSPSMECPKGLERCSHVFRFFFGQEHDLEILM